MQQPLRIRGAFRGASRGSPARVAQLAEQLSCKQQVRSSILLSGSVDAENRCAGSDHLRIRRSQLPSAAEPLNGRDVVQVRDGELGVALGDHAHDHDVGARGHCGECREVRPPWMGLASSQRPSAPHRAVKSRITFSRQSRSGSTASQGSMLFSSKVGWKPTQPSRGGAPRDPPLAGRRRHRDARPRRRTRVLGQGLGDRCGGVGPVLDGPLDAVPGDLAAQCPLGHLRCVRAELGDELTQHLVGQIDPAHDIEGTPRRVPAGGESPWSDRGTDRQGPQRAPGCSRRPCPSAAPGPARSEEPRADGDAADTPRARLRKGRFTLLKNS